MSVVIETTLGDITIDLLLEERPRACLNFLKLCKLKYYNYNLFHTIERGFIAQTGDPNGSRNEGESVYGVIHGPSKRFFKGEQVPCIKHTDIGQVSFVCNDEGMIGSQFFFTLGTDLNYLDKKHCVFAKVVEGMDVLDLINETICDTANRPYKDVRITHTVVLDDPYPDIKGMIVPDRSPSPSAERLKGGRIAADEDIDDTMGKSIVEVTEMLADREAKARATILEMVGDIPDADMAPPENVLFVCKLNPATTDDDLEIIFSRFGKIVSCEVIRDKKSGDSLQYAFVEFDNPKSCEQAYFKMDNVLIDDRRVHVDFSQSVAKVKWHGKGRLTTYDVGGGHTDLGKGIYRRHEGTRKEPRDKHKPPKRRSVSPVGRVGAKDRDTQGSRHNYARRRDDRTQEFNSRRYEESKRSGLHPRDRREHHQRLRDYGNRSRDYKNTSLDNKFASRNRYESGRPKKYQDDRHHPRHTDRNRTDSHHDRNRSRSHKYVQRDKDRRESTRKENDRSEKRESERIMEKDRRNRSRSRSRKRSNRKSDDDSSSSESTSD